MTKFYVDGDGVYLGGFDGTEPPEGSVEVEVPPPDGRCRLVNGEWKVPAAITNAPILAQLEQIDLKTIRPLRDGEAARVAELKAQAAALRMQLVRD